MREATITRNILKALEARGAYVVKQHGSMYAKAGVPDLLVCVHSTFYALEVKQPGKYATAVQTRNLAQITRAGGVSAVVRSVEEAMEVVYGRAA